MGHPNEQYPWDDSCPEPLLDICSRYVILHPHTFCYFDEGKWNLRTGLALPTEICEKLINIWQDYNPGALDDSFVNIFRDLASTRIKRVNVRNSSISDDGMELLLSHSLMELDISNCATITNRTLDNLNRYGENLTALVIANTKNMPTDSLHLLLPPPPLPPPAPQNKSKEGMSRTEVGNEFEKRGYILKTPNLKRLVVRELYMPMELQYFSLLLKPLTKLTHLDLSGCYSLDDLSYILHLGHLISLKLHNVQRIQDTISTICKLKTLRFLDISQANQKFGHFENPNAVLTRIVTSLPLLTGLDISGTNLPGDGTFQREPDMMERYPDSVKAKGLEPIPVLPVLPERPNCDIPGLRSRADNHLEFLGLYNTAHDACLRHHIPAVEITGDANEAQILAATSAYIDRPEMLVNALNELFQIFRFETCRDQHRALNLIIKAMLSHRHEKHIQISGSASLFYIAKSEDKGGLNVRARQKMISVLLDAMETHLSDSTMMRNGCLTLCHFRIPQDVLFEYRRLVQLLLKLVGGTEGEDFVRKVAIYLLNSLACQVDGDQKELVGDLGAIQTMLKLIKGRLDQHVCDDVLEIAWSAMWNVTDETPVNCKRFLDGKGMTYFQQCLKKFEDKPELLRNMMGLLGNVAEVSSLRGRLMTTTLITTFADLLDSPSDGIEVSYNAAGVLSHIASDGHHTWTIESPTREEVLERMVAAIERWNLSAKRNINYRSFEPILRLLKVTHTPQCQHWAVWALANLTRVYPDKYCSLVEEEHGLDLLRNQELFVNSYQRIKDLASIVIKQCEIFKEYGTLEDMDWTSMSSMGD
ncbi:protein zer-1 homolog [Oratosquilla oratoria]|uniref:protein zer-1 homolog n=1 Tax=Oratosquilla oratoria TaxID=337810 RepID=UPI003F761D10